MKTTQTKLLCIAMILSLITGCRFFGNDVLENNRSGEDKISAESIIPTKDVRAFLSELFNGKETGIWQCVYPENGEHERVELVEAMPAANIETVIEQLNSRFQSSDQPVIQLSQIEADTVTITVTDDRQLGEQMGSSGASCYLATVTYSLTSVEGVDYVWFDITEGSHAMPGRYGREDFSELWPLQAIAKPPFHGSKSQ